MQFWKAISKKFSDVMRSNLQSNNIFSLHLQYMQVWVHILIIISKDVWIYFFYFFVL